MSTDKRAESPHEFLRCCWPQEFTKRRRFNRRAENETYIQWLQGNFDNGGEEVDEVDSDDDGVDSSRDARNPAAAPNDNSENKADTSNDDNDVEDCNDYRNVRIFMEGMLGDENALPYRDQVEKVAKFCEQASLERDPRSLGKNRKAVSLLDDRNDGGTISGRGGHCRPYLGPLSPRRLRKELGRQVDPIVPHPRTFRRTHTRYSVSGSSQRGITSLRLTKQRVMQRGE
jgi:hypothetical protein